MSTWSELKDNPRLRKIYQTRLEILRLTREFFWSQGFVEAETPIALRHASQEPYLNFFPVTVTHAGGSDHRFYLRTSPEFALKKLLAAGYSKVFEIGKCFRNNEDFGGTHNPEFTLIEWYRAPGTYQDFMEDMEKLFKYVAAKLASPVIPTEPRGEWRRHPEALPGGNPLAIATHGSRDPSTSLRSARDDNKVREVYLKYKDCKINISERWDRMSMKAVWQKYAGVNLDKFLELEKLVELVKVKGYQANENDTYDDLFFKIFLNEIEPHLGTERPVFVYDYPAQMASLSRLCEYDPRYAERVECYIGGLELANGFGELTDADEQKRRLENDKKLRKQLGKETWPVDEDFINALTGLPAIAQRATAGVAMGVDRMVLLFTGARDINEVIFGSVKDQIE